TTLELSAVEITPEESVELIADVGVLDPARGVPTGAIEFRLDGQVVDGPVELSAMAAALASDGTTATLSLEDLDEGTYVLQAQYSGDGNFLGSQSAEIALTVAEPPAADPLDPPAPDRVGAGMPSTGLPGHLAGVAMLALLLAMTGAVLK